MKTIMMGEYIEGYLAFEQRKKEIEEEMAKDPAIVELKAKLKAVTHEIEQKESKYKVGIQLCDAEMSARKEILIDMWGDSSDKTFKCAVGSATMRITRSLKIDNTEKLINILEKIGKLAKSIRSWDLAYLRKLADAGLFNELEVTHYDEKRSIMIRGAKEGEEKDEE